jgi:hypothetical protein
MMRPLLGGTARVARGGDAPGVLDAHRAVGAGLPEAPCDAPPVQAARRTGSTKVQRAIVGYRAAAPGLTPGPYPSTN